MKTKNKYENLKNFLVQIIQTRLSLTSVRLNKARFDELIGKQN